MEHGNCSLAKTFFGGLRPRLPSERRGGSCGFLPLRKLFRRDTGLPFPSRKKSEITEHMFRSHICSKGVWSAESPGSDGRGLADDFNASRQRRLLLIVSRNRSGRVTDDSKRADQCGAVAERSFFTSLALWQDVDRAYGSGAIQAPRRLCSTGRLTQLLVAIIVISDHSAGAADAVASNAIAGRQRLTIQRKRRTGKLWPVIPTEWGNFLRSSYLSEFGSGPVTPLRGEFRNNQV